MRVIRALHELGIEAVAVYSTADADALHVRLADRAVCIGPPPAAESYLRIPSVVAAAETTGCEAVHPGYGFLAENPAFVEACAASDLAFVGPPAEVMRRLGDKAEAKAELRAAGVPLVPGTDGVVGEPHVECVAVRGGVDGNCLDPELVERADHPHGDLAPVRDEHALEHRTAPYSAGGPLTGSSSNRSWPYSTGCALSTWIFRTTASSSALTSFISFIASRMHSVWPGPTASPSSTNAAAPGEGAR